MHLVEEKWDEILLTVKREHELTDISFNTWLKPLQIFSIQNNRIYILVSGEQMGLTYINRKYYLPLKVAVAEVTGTEYEIEFVLPEQAKKLKTPHPRRRATTEEAERSNLMHSIAHFIQSTHPALKVLYVSSETFTNELIEAIRNGNNMAMSRFREKYRSMDVLLIDDVQFIIGKESTQEEFFHTFNELHVAKKQIILSSDRPPKEMETLEERIRSRFEWGLLADIGSPDYETRMAILRKKEELDGVSLDDAILNYIALNIKSNIRELEGALNKLVAYENLVQTEITMEIAEKELQNIISPDIPLEVTPQLVVEVVAEHFGITMDQITSKSRSNDVAKPRQIAMYLCKNMTDASLETIGKAVGGRDHSTVVHGIKKVGDDISTDTSVERLVATIRKKINPH